MNYARSSHFHPTKLPPVTISKTDRARLVSIAVAALTDRRRSAAASNLLRELDRATIVPDAQFPENVVAVHSRVHLRDNITGEDSRITLVLPGETCAGPNALSVLTLLGAALIGLSEGASIDWCAASGDRSSKTVLRCE
ncbi:MULTISPECIES: GreA/GreB family elongation factor [unclassified Bradyrhizobium]|uniref:GreA/GreB family elongation factor n=1 Tax=unclassified Bradyrhizobium TaxID=2631580 RepID=UPI00247A8D2C|nr:MULTISPECIES: GreA/GreB family elongation factor [unclassified Bradyrhizobium]WGS18846.1 GreA/GreB family elongation factor [Bradyrhizobium sp. ISRA463]WGS25674.1 GreA/GreB family elongation factor [Bradyrhizobium sp. ISRA464]